MMVLDKSGQIRALPFLLVIGIVIIPFVSSQKILDPVMVPRQMLLSIMALIAGVVLLTAKNVVFRYHPAFLPASALVLLYALSVNVAMNKAEAWYTLSKVALSMVWLFLLYQLIVNEVLSMKVIARAVCAFAMVSVGLTMYEMISLTSRGVTLFSEKNLYQLTTPFGHKNLFSSVLLLTLPASCYLVLYENRTIKWQAGAVVVISCLAIVVVQTKAVLLGMAAGILISFVAFVFLSENRNKLIMQGAVAVVLFCALVVGILRFKNHFILLLNTETLKERELLWENTFGMINEQGLFGVGGGNWQIFFPNYGLEKFMEINYMTSDGFRTFQRPHNDFLWVWSETGILGVMVYAGIFLFALYTGVKNLFIDRFNRKKMIFQLILIMTLTAYLFTAFFDFPLERSEHQFLLMLMLAVIFGDHIRYTGILSTAKGRAVLVAALMVASFSLSVSVKRFNGETGSHKLIVAHAQGSWEQMIRVGNQTVNVFYNMDNFSVPVSWYIGVAQFSLGNLAAAKASFEKAYRIHPYQIHVLNNYATCFEKEGNHNQAVTLFDEMLRISPTSPDGIINRSGALFNSGRYEEAYEGIKRFKFDETNEKFKGFALAIIKVRIEDYAAAMSLEKENKKVIDLLNDNEKILTLFKTSQLEKKNLDTLLVAQLK